MTVYYEKSFDKQFSRLKPAQKKLAIRRLQLFVVNQFAPELRNHALKAEWLGYRSISVGGDLRIHFKERGMDAITVVAIGTHSQLYK
ncbi:MAG: type II toxin-antitoxin system mRNA interferase toxin, RelE/StbE family [Patescibacteria group bacterium]